MIMFRHARVASLPARLLAAGFTLAVFFLPGCKSPAVPQSGERAPFSATSPECGAASEYSEARRGVSLLVLRDGEVICEAYAHGVGPMDAFPIASGTKSFSGLMALVAQEDGLLDLDEPVSATLPEWREDPQKSRVTIRQVLNLTSGISNMREELGRVPSFDEVVSAPMLTPPGETFRYGPAPFQLFGEVMKRKLRAAGRDPDPARYMEQRLLDPAGIELADWRRPVTGDPLMPAGIHISAREWAKFGEFVRLRGQTAEGRLLAEGAFAELFRGSEPNPGYGLTWWLPEPGPEGTWAGMTSDLGARRDEVPEDLIVAAGAGGQRLYVSATDGMVIARQARFDPSMSEDERNGDWSDTDKYLLARAAAYPAGQSFE